VHWFRKGLRLHDNPALLDALRGEPEAVFPGFVLDPWFCQPANVGLVRYRFLHECLGDLDTSLKQRGSRLLVVQGKPTEALPVLFAAYRITRLTFESDTEPYALVRDKAVKEAAEATGVDVATFASHMLRDPEQYLGLNKGKAPGTYQSFLKLYESINGGQPDAPLPAPDVFPPWDSAAAPTEVHLLPTLEDLGYHDSNAAAGESTSGKCSKASTSSLSASSSALSASPGFFDPKAKGSGTSNSDQLPMATKYPGGETEGLRRLNEHVARTTWIATFEKPNTAPNSLQPSTTVLSPYLKFGCISPRLFWVKLEEAYAKAGKKTLPPVSLSGQLLWREYFTLTGYVTPNFDQMAGNPICKQIDWDTNPAFLKAWEDGQTGYPFIDAIMTQLRVEGWVHHLARHAVACFLTRGDLYQSWEAGAKVFDKLLIDADWSLNNANWMWLSCSSFFYQYFRCYSPVAFGKKTDPNGDYIRKWCPKLRKYPAKFIFEPWKAPMAVQKECGCIIGADYPARIVDHDIVLKVNMGRMKAAYDAGKDASAGGGGGVSSSSSSGVKRPQLPSASPAKKKKN
jgi:cryptochrome